MIKVLLSIHSKRAIFPLLDAFSFLNKKIQRNLWHIQAASTVSVLGRKHAAFFLPVERTTKSISGQLENQTL